MVCSFRGSVVSQVDRMDLVGSVEDSDVIIVDDMIDTAGTLCKAASVIKEYGGGGVCLRGWKKSVEWLRLLCWC